MEGFVSPEKGCLGLQICWLNIVYLNITGRIKFHSKVCQISFLLFVPFSRLFVPFSRLFVPFSRCFCHRWRFFLFFLQPFPFCFPIIIFLLSFFTHFSTTLSLSLSSLASSRFLSCIFLLLANCLLRFLFGFAMVVQA